MSELLLAVIGTFACDNGRSSCPGAQRYQLSWARRPEAVCAEHVLVESYDCIPMLGSIELGRPCSGT